MTAVHEPVGASEQGDSELSLLRRRVRMLEDFAETQVLLDAADFNLEQFMQLAVDRLANVSGSSGVVVELVDDGEMVYRAADGAQAVARAQAMPLDLILMDIPMPGMDGLEAAARIHHEPGPNQDIPMLAFTAEFRSRDPQWRSANGFCGLVSKPLIQAELLAAVACATARDDTLSTQEADHVAATRA